MGARQALLGITVGTLVALAAVVIRSNSVVSTVLHIDPVPPRTAFSATDVDRGRYLAEVILRCSECHGADLGGQAEVELPGWGRRPAPNLTSGEGGVGGTYAPVDWTRAIRHGLRSDGTLLLGMPSLRYAGVTDLDLSKLIAWLARLPAVDRHLPSGSLRPTTRLALATGRLIPDATVSDHAGLPGTLATPAPSADFGAYLADIAGCHDCHGADLRGADGPDISHAALKDWTGAEFARATKHGLGRDGRALDPSMPSAALNNITDLELDALWAYVRAVPPGP